MRLIDADALVKALEMFSDILTDCKIGEGVWYALGFVKDAPKIDAVPVVRCKDCKHWERDVMFGGGWCRGKRQDIPDWFCADGERSEDAQKAD